MSVRGMVPVALGTIAILAWLAWGFAANLRFDRSCGGYLSRAGRASTVELAEESLARAISYLDDRQITSGSTAILWNTPETDVGFWYSNLNAASGELRRIQPEDSQLLKTNVLMKLRETLLGPGHDGQVAAPPGISLFPNNRAFALTGLVLIPVGVVIARRLIQVGRLHAKSAQTSTAATANRGVEAVGDAHPTPERDPDQESGQRVPRN